MSIIDTLIIDRTQADAELARRLGAMGWAAMTDEQRALYLSDQLKGAYKASDLNRVNAAMDYLVGRLKAQGINVPIKRSKIPHKQSGGKRLPEGHNELKWIESTGTQYVDTLFKPNQDTRVVGEFEATALRNYRFSFGVRTSTTTNAFAVASGLTQVFYNYGTKYAFANYGNTYERMTIDANKNIATFTGTETVTISLAAQTFTAEYNLLVGSYINGGNPGGDIDGWAGKIFYTQIYDNGILIRDYIPDMLDSGEVGLYDMVEGKFYPNAGTGVFLAGDVVDTSTSEVLDDYTWYDSDVPTPAQLVEHLANVSSVRSALRAALPEIPADMDDGLTIAEANNIELVLLNLEQLINNMLSAWVYCAEIYSDEV